MLQRIYMKIQLKNKNKQTNLWQHSDEEIFLLRLELFEDEVETTESELKNRDVIQD